MSEIDLGSCSFYRMGRLRREPVHEGITDREGGLYVCAHYRQERVRKHAEDPR